MYGTQFTVVLRDVSRANGSTAFLLTRRVDNITVKHQCKKSKLFTVTRITSLTHILQARLRKCVSGNLRTRLVSSSLIQGEPVVEKRTERNYLRIFLSCLFQWVLKMFFN